MSKHTWPNFMVIGSQRCGTTAFCFNIDKHPEATFCRPLECHYFSDDDKYSRGLPWYSSLFQHVRGEKAIGDGSVTYSSPRRSSFVLPRIHEMLPHCRIIHLARHPLKRLESAWKHAQRRADDRRSFAEAMRSQSFLQNSLYWKQISPYRDFFPDSQIHTVLFEDYVQDPQAVLAETFRFLGVASEFVVDDPDHIPNPSANLRMSRPWANMLANNTLVGNTLQLMPRSVRNVVRAIATQPISQEARWESTLREKIVALIRDDAVQYLKYCGKPADFWELDVE